MSLILQKHGEDDGWTTERAALDATGILRARLPTVSRTNGQESMAENSKHCQENAKLEAAVTETNCG